MNWVVVLLVISIISAIAWWVLRTEERLKRLEEEHSLEDIDEEDEEHIEI